MARVGSERWQNEISPMLAASIKGLREATEQGDPRDPKFVVAVAASVKILAEVYFSRQLLEARRRERVASDVELSRLWESL